MPYTRVLLDAVPRLDLPPHSPLPVVSLRAPDPTRPAPGCAFAPRCPRCADDCRQQDPVLEEHENEHFWACFHPEEPAARQPEAPAYQEEPGHPEEAMDEAGGRPPQPVRKSPAREAPAQEAPAQEVRQ
jgi:oligopeptide/dipeptide ABC transporter ATP-binding protein